MMDIDDAVRIAEGIAGIEPRFVVADLDFALRIAEGIVDVDADAEAADRPGVGRHHSSLQRARVLARWREAPKLVDRRQELQVHVNNFQAVRADDRLRPLVAAGKLQSGKSSLCPPPSTSKQRHYSMFEPRAYLAAGCCEAFESAVDVARRFPLCGDEVEESKKRFASSRFITDTKFAIADLVRDHINGWCASTFRHHDMVIMKCNFSRELSYKRSACS